MLLPASDWIGTCVHFFECMNFLNAFALVITYSKQHLVFLYSKQHSFSLGKLDKCAHVNP